MEQWWGGVSLKLGRRLKLVLAMGDMLVQPLAEGLAYSWGSEWVVRSGLESESG